MIGRGKPKNSEKPTGVPLRPLRISFEVIGIEPGSPW
jgi:hypothetical protein